LGKSSGTFGSWKTAVVLLIVWFLPRCCCRAKCVKQLKEAGEKKNPSPVEVKVDDKKKE